MLEPIDLFLGQLIGDQKITLTWKPVTMNPLWATAPGLAHHYRVTLWKNMRPFTTYYSKGLAHPDPPSAAEVLEALAQDAFFIEAVPDYDEWAQQLELDPADPETYDVWRDMKKTLLTLKKFLGPDVYSELMSLVQES